MIAYQSGYTFCLLNYINVTIVWNSTHFNSQNKTFLKQHFSIKKLGLPLSSIKLVKVSKVFDYSLDKIVTFLDNSIACSTSHMNSR